MADDLPQHWILHELDEETVRHESALGKLPELRKAQDARVAAELRKVDADRQKLADHDRTRRALERELDAFADQEKKFRAQLDLVTNQQQFEAVQHEIATVEGKRSDIETRVLTIMDEEDALKTALPAHESALAKARAESDAVHAKLAAEEAMHREAIAALEARRVEAVAALDAPSRSRYERTRTARDRRAVAAVSNNACGACFRTLAPQLMQDVNRRDRLVQCDGCGRLLVLPPDGAAGA